MTIIGYVLIGVYVLAGLIVLGAVGYAIVNMIRNWDTERVQTLEGQVREWEQNDAPLAAHSSQS